MRPRSYHHDIHPARRVSGSIMGRASDSRRYMSRLMKQDREIVAGYGAMDEDSNPERERKVETKPRR